MVKAKRRMEGCLVFRFGGLVWWWLVAVEAAETRIGGEYLKGWQGFVTYSIVDLPHVKEWRHCS